MLGQTIDGKYQIVRLLGQGGMGAVYEATHLGTGRRLALKVIIANAPISRESVLRFQREARAAGSMPKTMPVTALTPRAATIAIGEAVHDVQEGRILPVPRHLQDSHYAGAKRLGHGQDYQYAHDAPGGVAAQDYLGIEREYYRPVDRGFETELATRLASIRAQLRGNGSQ